MQMGAHRGPCSLTLEVDQLECNFFCSRRSPWAPPFQVQPRAWANCLLGICKLHETVEWYSTVQRRSGNQTPRSFGNLLCFGHTVDFGSSDGIEETTKEDDDTSVAEPYILPIIANISCPYAILTSARIQPGFLPHFSRETKVPIRHRTHSQDTTPDRFPTNIVSTSRHFPLPAQVGFVQE